MALQKVIVLITGANGGIGYELASLLLADSTKHVLLGSRSLEKGKAALEQLESKNQPGTVELLQLDVSNEDSITAAAREVQAKHGRLDALVNNAAVAIPEGTISQQMALCFQTNATGPFLMGEAFEPLLKKSTTTPRIVNVSSGAGSMALYLQPRKEGAPPSPRAPQYRASKAALNMITAIQANDYDSLGWKVFSYCPGFTVSNLSGMNKSENGAKPTKEGAEPIVRILNGERDGEHAGFLTGDGQYSW